MQSFTANSHNIHFLRCLILTALLGAGSAHAQSILGQTSSTYSARTELLSGVRIANNSATTPATISTTASYTVRSNTLETGTTFSEYSNAHGIVFAIAWQGPTLPPLQTVLGNYFGQFKEQAQSSRAQRNIGTPLQFASTDLVMLSSGRMRNFSGYAYAPSLVPDNLKMADVLP